MVLAIPSLNIHDNFLKDLFYSKTYPQLCRATDKKKPASASVF